MPLAMMGNTDKLLSNFGDGLVQAFGVRLITESLIQRNGERVKLILGTNIEEIEKTARWFSSSLTHTIVNKANNLRLYHKLLYTVVPNWKILDPKLKLVTKTAFQDAAQ
jgi:hypothetical protein